MVSTPILVWVLMSHPPGIVAHRGRLVGVISGCNRFIRPQKQRPDGIKELDVARVGRLVRGSRGCVRLESSLKPERGLAGLAQIGECSRADPGEQSVTADSSLSPVQREKVTNYLADFMPRE